jgi:hypothetical protein
MIWFVLAQRQPERPVVVLSARARRAAAEESPAQAAADDAGSAAENAGSVAEESGSAAEHTEDAGGSQDTEDRPATGEAAGDSEGVATARSEE